jgi:glycerol-3-phosphate dehydrogenase subunit C
MALEQGDLTSVPVEWDKPEYWDPSALDTELRRQYDVCNSCRLCFNLCPAFPALFGHFDSDEVDANPDKLTNGQVHEFVDLCYNCKLCFIKCPYTPPHKFLIDIPKVVMRARAIETKRDGVELRERLLSDPDHVGPVASRTAPLTNFANRNPVSRWLMDELLGIHRQKILPTFHATTFARWFKRRFGSSRPSPSPSCDGSSDRPRVAIFHTCIVNYNEPQIGRAMVGVLEKNQIEFADPEGQRCCGMPGLDSGRLDLALDDFRHNVGILLLYVRDGYDIVVPEPTCGMMLKKEYLDYLQGEERAQAAEVASRVFDLSEYLIRLKQRGKLNEDFVSPPGRVAYHQPCHLKYQAIGTRSIELLRLAAAEVVFIDKGCSGHDGTWAMKKEYFDLAQKVARGLHKGVKESQADIVATDCSLAGMQITQGTGRKTIHPVEVLARAYGLDSDR